MKKINSKVVKKSSGVETVLKDAVYADKPLKDPPENKERRVGLSVGVTINQGDFQSLRCDCWASENVRDNELPAETFARIREMLNEELTTLVAEYSED